MYKGIQVYKGIKLADKVAVLPGQVRKKIEFMMARKEHLSIDGASIILAELCGVLLGLRRSEHLASAEKNPNKTTLLCFRNLTGITWDLGDMTKQYNLASWAHKLRADEIIKVRLCYSKHQRHRVAHEVVAGPGYRQITIVVWLKILILLRVRHGEKLTVDSPILVRLNREKTSPHDRRLYAENG